MQGKLGVKGRSSLIWFSGPGEGRQAAPADARTGKVLPEGPPQDVTVRAHGMKPPWTEILRCKTEEELCECAHCGRRNRV